MDIIDTTALILPLTERNDEAPREPDSQPLTPNVIRSLYPPRPFRGPLTIFQDACLAWAKTRGFLVLGDDGTCYPTLAYLALRAGGESFLVIGDDGTCYPTHAYLALGAGGES